MLIAIGLGLMGLLLIYFEFFVPGGVLAVLGALFMIVGMTVCITMQTTPYGVFIYVGGLILLLILVIRVALWRVRESKHQTLYLKQDQEGYLAVSYDADLIGKKGIALTNLKPSGHISVEEEQYQAVSQGSFIQKGDPIVVMGGEGARLIVKKE